MSVEFYRESSVKFDSRTLRRETLSRWTGRSHALRYTDPEEGMYLINCQYGPDTETNTKNTCIYTCVCILYKYIYIYIYIVCIHMYIYTCS